MVVQHRVALDQRSGLFTTVIDGCPRTSVDFAELVDARRRLTAPLTLNETFLRGFAQIDLSGQETPFTEIRRVPPGWEVEQSSHGLGSPRPWITSAELPAPTWRGTSATGHYLDVFDRTVAESVPDSGPLAVMLSGGLDSTFLAASLVRHATPDRPVLAFHHAPCAAALSYLPIGTQDYSETGLVQEFAAAYPGLIDVHTVTNDAGVLGLDAAETHSRATWWPVFNPANQVWLDALRARANASGATVLFTGTAGNFAFSYGHPFALAHAVRQRRLWLAGRMAIGQRAGGRTSRAVFGEIRRGDNNPHQTIPGRHTYHDRLGIPRTLRQKQSDRDAWLRLLLGDGRSFSAGQQVTARINPPWYDPFTAESVVRAAAAVHPVEWQLGPYPRGFARRMGLHRVPAPIRLRRQRGQQSADAWWHMRHQRDRYFDEWTLLGDTPVLRGWLDPAATGRILHRWPWGTPEPPPRAEIVGVDRILSLAAYIRMIHAECVLQTSQPTRERPTQGKSHRVERRV